MKDQKKVTEVCRRYIKHGKQCAPLEFKNFIVKIENTKEVAMYTYVTNKNTRYLIITYGILLLRIIFLNEL